MRAAVHAARISRECLFESNHLVALHFAIVEVYDGLSESTLDQRQSWLHGCTAWSVSLNVTSADAATNPLAIVSLRKGKIEEVSMSICEEFLVLTCRIKTSHLRTNFNEQFVAQVDQAVVPDRNAEILVKEPAH